MENSKKENIFEEFTSLLEEEMKTMGHANIIIAGKTGVGKSTLINAAFRENLATTGIGLPVTKSCKMIQKEGFPLRIYDTVGLELNQQTQTESINEIRSLIRTKIQQNNPDEFIHCLWYCIQSDSERFEDAEFTFIKEIAEDVPVILVLTKAYFKKHAETFQAILESYNLPVKNIIIVLASTFTEDDYVKNAFGVNHLVEFTCSLLPESAQKAWINAQQASLKIKKEKAMDIVLKTATGSFGIGFLPIPFSDCVALSSIQVAMIAKITSIFGFTIQKSVISGIFTSLIGTVGATLAGRTLVSNLLKMIPGVGTLAGSSISGTTAALLTTALGKTYITIMEMMFKGEIDEKNINSESVQKKINKILKENMD